MGGALVSRDEKIAWEQDARSSSAHCPFLSGLRRGCDPCSLLHSHPQLLREHLGCPRRGWSGTAASAWARQPGSRQAPGYQNEVNQGWIPGRAAAYQSLALSLLRASQTLPKRQNLGGDPERLPVGMEAETAKDEVRPVWSGRDGPLDTSPFEFSGWMRPEVLEHVRCCGAPGTHCRDLPSLGP